MEYIIRGRQGGKTEALIQLFRLDPEHSVIVCPNEREAERIRFILEEQWHLSRRITLNNVITTERTKYLRGRNAKVYVDNLDRWVQSVFGNVQAVTMTEE